MKRQALCVALCCGVLILSGCRQSAQPTATPNPDIHIELTIPEDSFVVGQTILLITLRDAGGAPIDGARIEVRGDMNHAGMVPSLGGVEGGAAGLYAVPFNWTMGGDWFLDVQVTLPDGREAARRFDLRVRAR
jgi:hypothetical protein